MTRLWDQMFLTFPLRNLRNILILDFLKFWSLQIPKCPLCPFLLDQALCTHHLPLKHAFGGLFLSFFLVTNHFSLWQKQLGG